MKKQTREQKQMMLMMLVLRKKLKMYISTNSYYYSNKEIAEKIGLSQYMLSKFCLGQRNLGLKNYLKVSNFLKEQKKVV